MSAADLDDLNIEIIRNTVYKAYLEDFYAFCSSLGGATEDVMHRVLAFEADRRTLNITINSFNTELTKENRAQLFPAIGRLFPAGNNALAKADDLDTVRAVCENVQEYRSFFDGAPGGGQANGVHSGDQDESAAVTQLEDHFFHTEVHYNKLAFLQQVRSLLLSIWYNDTDAC